MSTTYDDLDDPLEPDESDELQARLDRLGLDQAETVCETVRRLVQTLVDEGYRPFAIAAGLAQATAEHTWDIYEITRDLGIEDDSDDDDDDDDDDDGIEIDPRPDPGDIGPAA